MGNVDPAVVMADTILRLLILEGLRAFIWCAVAAPFYVIARLATR